MATFLGDAGFALATGVVAAAAWSLLVLAWQWKRMQRALDAFVGSYKVRRKLRDAEDNLGTVEIRREGRALSIQLDSPKGLARAVVRLSERFPRSGHGTYEHRLHGGRLAWGTWDLELDPSGAAVLVTTRYAHPVEMIEIVQGYEWQRTTGSDG